MEVASLPKIRKELTQLPPEELLEILNRLAKYKKENKELLDYLLFRSADELSFIAEVKQEVETEFEGINRQNLFWARKSIRRILRLVNKYVRYSGKPETDIELRAHYCKTLRSSGISFRHSAALSNLYEREVKRVEKAIGNLHEDVRFDYRHLMAEIE